MITYNNPKLRDLIILHEGLRLTTYPCTKGKMTIGVGHNLDARPILGLTWGSKITKEQAYSILDNDLGEVLADVKSRIGVFHQLNEPRQAVLVDMVFNMGVDGVLKFKNFLRALHLQNWDWAQDEMFDSRWAFQVGDGPGGKFDRVDRLAKMIRTGEWL